jgi:predicted RNA-binding protein with PUA-like domain
MKFKEKLAKPITLESIKKTKELKDLSLIKQSRLSVMPIDPKSWKILCKMGKL